MSNWVPYLALILISGLLLIPSWFKARNKKLIPLYFAAAGFIYIFEFIVLVLFKSYVYRPHILADQYFDNILGANVSDGFIVPSATVFLAVFDLNLWWVLLFALGFVGIEEMFLHLDVYRHYWWKSLYTGLSMPVQFALGKWVWKVIRFRINQFTVRILILYLNSIAIQATLLFYSVAFFHLFLFRVHWFDDPSRSHIAFATLYTFINSFFLSLLVGLRAHWARNILFIASVSGINIVLYRLHVLEASTIWAAGLLSLSDLVMLAALIYIQKLLLRRMPAK